MKSFLLILCFYPFNLFAPPAQLSQQDVIKAWEFNFLMNPFSPARLKTALEIFIDNPEIAFAQARLESGEFTSNIWIENHNPFGIHQPKIRQTYSIGENRHCARYRHWIYSVLDYKLMQEYYYKKGYNHDYFLKKYCPEKGYSKKLCNMIK